MKSKKRNEGQPELIPSVVNQIKSMVKEAEAAKQEVV